MAFRVGPWVVLLLLAHGTAAQGPNSPANSKCGCFLTNGSNSDYFTNHRFYDFRSLSQFTGDGVPHVPDNGAANASSAPATSAYFLSSNFTDDWSIMTWNNSDSVGKDAKYLMVNSPTNLFIEKNADQNPASDTYLTMRTARHRDYQSASELESKSEYRYLSVRMLARTTGAPGACTAIFTYRPAKDLADVQEADIEVLTKDPDRRIQYTNQPSYTQNGNDIAGSNVNGTAPLPWTEWAVHRLDWTPRKTTWFINDQQVASISFQVPRDSSRLNLNSWGDGGVWTGPMEVGKEARMQIQWIEMVFNKTSTSSTDTKTASAADTKGTSAATLARRHNGRGHNHDQDSSSGQFQGLSSDGKSCKTVCSIDKAAERGSADVVADGDSPTSAGSPPTIAGSASRLAGWAGGAVTLIMLVSSMML